MARKYDWLLKMVKKLTLSDFDENISIYVVDGADYENHISFRRGIILIEI